MAIHTQQSVSGFIASTPQLSFTDRGDARFYAKIGQEHYQRNEDGSFTKLETTFHDLVQYRRAAERAYNQFRKGDRFVAEGYVRAYEYEIDGQTQQGEEFVAKKLGHDTARTTYAVDRTPRAQRSGPEAGEALDASAATAGATSAPSTATTEATNVTSPPPPPPNESPPAARHNETVSM